MATTRLSDMLEARFEDGTLPVSPNLKLFGREVTDVIRSPYCIQVLTKKQAAYDEPPVFIIPIIASQEPLVSYGFGEQNHASPLHPSLRDEARRFALACLANGGRR